MRNTHVVSQPTGRASNDAFIGFGDRFLASIHLWSGILCLIAGVTIGILYDSKLGGGLAFISIFVLLSWVVFGRLGRYGSIAKHG